MEEKIEEKKSSLWNFLKNLKNIWSCLTTVFNNNFLFFKQKIKKIGLIIKNWIYFLFLPT